MMRFEDRRGKGGVGGNTRVGDRSIVRSLVKLSFENRDKCWINLRGSSHPSNSMIMNKKEEKKSF